MQSAEPTDAVLSCWAQDIHQCKAQPPLHCKRVLLLPIFHCVTSSSRSISVDLHSAIQGGLGGDCGCVYG